MFERAFIVMEAILGSRHPRSAAVQGNIDKSKKSLGIKMHIKDIKECISIRPDADRLFTGSKYIISAFPPQGKTKKLKKKGGKGGGKKKK